MTIFFLNCLLLLISVSCYCALLLRLFCALLKVSLDEVAEWFSQMMNIFDEVAPSILGLLKTILLNGQKRLQKGILLLDVKRSGRAGVTRSYSPFARSS